jgi:hypothetical protein
MTKNEMTIIKKSIDLFVRLLMRLSRGFYSIVYWTILRVDLRSFASTRAPLKLRRSVEKSFAQDSEFIVSFVSAIG